jgi:MraZ protein
MLGFHGKYNYSVDIKGRVNIPAKFRKALLPEAADTFIVCRAPGGCLRAFPQNFWHSYVAELNGRPETPETVLHKRLLYDTASESTLDAQGRIALMPNQMTIAGITREVTLVGHEQYIEIWDMARYAVYLGNAADFDTVFFQSVPTVRIEGK